MSSVRYTECWQPTRVGVGRSRRIGCLKNGVQPFEDDRSFTPCMNSLDSLDSLDLKDLEDSQDLKGSTAT